MFTIFLSYQSLQDIKSHKLISSNTIVGQYITTIIIIIIIIIMPFV